MDDWTSSAIEDKLYDEMCDHDDDEENDEEKYSVRILKYAHRRAIVKELKDFTDVIIVYLHHFSAQLREQIINLCSESDSIDAVITNVVKKIIKSRAARIYHEYIQNEPLRWRLLDGKEKNEGSGIAEFVQFKASSDDYLGQEENKEVGRKREEDSTEETPDKQNQKIARTKKSKPSVEENYDDKKQLKKKVFIRKYTGNGTLPLHESAVVAGQSTFLCLTDNDKFQYVPYIEGANKLFYPADTISKL
jgi:hypothetical protein